jgi:hypothetical protein
MLSNAQVARLETRRKMLGLSRAGLLKRFEAALQREGCVHTLSSAKMRLDRVLNPRLRRPATEPTLMALASALEWTFPELEAELQLTEAGNDQPALGCGPNGHAPRWRAMTAREIAFAMLLLFQTLPMVQAEKISANDLARTYTAVARTWKRGVDLNEQWPTGRHEREPTMKVNSRDFAGAAPRHFAAFAGETFEAVLSSQPAG